MADETVVVESELKLESPNMDEQSAAPKEVVVEPIPDKEKVGGEEPKAEPAEKIETVAEVVEPVVEQTDWKDKELKRKHAQIKERDRQLEEIRKENEALREMAGRQPKEGEEPAERPTPTQNMSQAQIQAAAAQLREQERYQEDLTKINTAGETAYKAEWGKALENLATLGTVEMPTMQGILATDDPAKVLYELGKNPAEYQRIMDLSPARRQTEFVKLSLKAAPKATVSKAPEPVETIRTRATQSDAMPPDNVSDDEWYAAWNAKQAEKFKKRA